MHALMRHALMHHTRMKCAWYTVHVNYGALMRIWGPIVHMIVHLLHANVHSCHINAPKCAFVCHKLQTHHTTTHALSHKLPRQNSNSNCTTKKQMCNTIKNTRRFYYKHSFQPTMLYVQPTSPNNTHQNTPPHMLSATNCHAKTAIHIAKQRNKYATSLKTHGGSIASIHFNPRCSTFNPQHQTTHTENHHHTCSLPQTATSKQQSASQNKETNMQHH